MGLIVVLAGVLELPAALRTCREDKEEFAELDDGVRALGIELLLPLRYRVRTISTVWRLPTQDRDGGFGGEVVTVLGTAEAALGGVESGVALCGVFCGV